MPASDTVSKRSVFHNCLARPTVNQFTTTELRLVSIDLQLIRSNDTNKIQLMGESKQRCADREGRRGRVSDTSLNQSVCFAEA